MFLDVIYLPSRPANGESLTRNAMLTVGSSTLKGGSASTFEESQMVSEIEIFSIPTIPTISPALAELTSCLSRPLNPSN